MMEDVLKILANPTNQAILSLLRAEPSYARKIATLLDSKESEVTRRLRIMEGAGLVASEWSYIGKNVKMYNLKANEIHIRLVPEGIHVDMGAETAGSSIIDPWTPRVPKPRHFVGRKAELERLAEAQGVMLVAGLPGIGKTSLLADYAARLEPSKVFWHSFRGIESLTWLANRIGVFLSHHGDNELLDAVQADADLPEKRERMLQGIDRSDVTFFFDDVHEIEDDIILGFLQDVVRHTRKGRVFLSSRERLRIAAATDADEIVLDGLTDEDVQQILAEEGVELAEGQAEEMGDLFGGHPLALHLLIAAAKNHDAGLEGMLKDVAAGLEARLEDFLLAEVDAGLSEAKRRVLVTASVFRTVFTVEDLNAVSTKRIHDKDVFDLQRMYLLEDRGGAYGLHEIVRTFFYDRIDDAKPLHLKVAHRLLDKGTTEGRIEALHHLLVAGQKQEVLKLLEENLDLREFDFIDSGYAQMYLETLELFTEAEVGDARRWALIEDERGDIHFTKGDYERALQHYAAANAYFGAHKEAGTEDEDLAWKMGMALAKVGRQEEAIDLVELALKEAPEGERATDRLQRLRQELAA